MADASSSREQMNTVDKAGKTFWDTTWQSRLPQTAVDPARTGLNNYRNLRFHDLYSRYLRHTNDGSAELIEVGCAGSEWLPYFAMQFRYKVTGLDYSELGCRQAADTLAAAGIKGEIVCDDLFHPPQRLLDRFDAVVSTGLVEHFEDTTTCIRALAAFARPGGLMITTIPNLAGVLGWLQKIVDKEVYDIHVPLNREQLAKCHDSAGLEVLSCRYFMSVNWSVLNFRRFSGSRIHNVLLRTASWSSKAIWIIERVIAEFPATRWFSPYIVCVAQKMPR
jgi:2-polyprenyl-3-methyl-5-hydroxy-6-metoxy-1,4-benzoquinol methylase